MSLLRMCSSSTTRMTRVGATARMGASFISVFLLSGRSGSFFCLFVEFERERLFGKHQRVHAVPQKCAESYNCLIALHRLGSVYGPSIVCNCMGADGWE